MAESGIVSRLLSFLRPDAAPEARPPVVGLPGGVSPSRWCSLADRERPVGYASEISAALDLYLGHARTDTHAALRRYLRNTADVMVPVSLSLLKRIIDETARVYAGAPEFKLENETTGEPVVEAGDRCWDDVCEDAQLAHKCVQINRLTRLMRRAFVRVTWDSERACPKLTIFPPHRVWPVFALDSRSLDRADGVLLEVAPTNEGTRPSRRFEFWSAGEQPQNFVIDEAGRISVGASEGVNPYATVGHEAIVPVVSFGDEDEDVAGYWALPVEQRLDAARAANVFVSDVLHKAKLQGYGQWISQVTGDNPAKWDGEIVLGPDEIVEAPRGRTLVNVAMGTEATATMDVLRAYLSSVFSLEGLPPGSILSDGRQVPSGTALEIERAPLMELRRDQIEVYRRPTQRLIDVVRIVWNAHQTSDATRFFGRPRFVPDPTALTGAKDPLIIANTDAAKIRNGVLSPAEILMRDEGLTREAAVERAALLKADNTGAALPGTPSGGRLSVAPPNVTDAGKAPAPASAPAENVAALAMNGAQVASLKDLLLAVASGELPRDAAASMIVVAFPTVTPAAADAMLASIKPRAFVPAP